MNSNNNAHHWISILRCLAYCKNRYQSVSVNVVQWWTVRIMLYQFYLTGWSFICTTPIAYKFTSNLIFELVTILAVIIRFSELHPALFLEVLRPSHCHPKYLKLLSISTYFLWRMSFHCFINSSATWSHDSQRIRALPSIWILLSYILPYNIPNLLKQFP